MTIKYNSALANRAPHRDAAIHLYALGQPVYLKGPQARFSRTLRADGVYHITATLPPKDGYPQYRIRSDSEKHERVTTQDNLEPVQTLQKSPERSLIDQTFGHM